MSSADQQQVVVCKWSAHLTSAMLELTPRVSVILDDFDVEHGDVDRELLSKAERVYRVGEFDSIEEIAAVASDLLVRGVSLDHIVSFTEFSQFGAGYLAALTGLTDDPSQHVAFRDKRLMKARVAAAGVPTADWMTLGDASDEKEVAAVRERLRFPVVVKPVAGSGSIGATRVDDPDELAASLRRVVADPHVKSRQVTAEEFVTGRELHVDALWRDGEPLLLTVSAYYCPRMSVLDVTGTTGSGQQDPVDGSYVIDPEEDPALYRAVADLHGKINVALGIRDGATHLEVFRRADGELVFSEIATRLAGGWVGGVLSECLGYEVHEALAHAVVTGRIPPARPTHRFLGGIHLRPTRAGRITAIPDVERMLSVDGVLRAQRIRDVGDRITLTHPSEWCAFVVIGADTREEYEALAHRVTALLRIEVAADEWSPTSAQDA
ncbi:ATP-grasp domain-containing protein [Streptomyces sp. ODS05-4]|uniref:ATP-grasp domain-containing protein n=1 Tax=Streptomyces sp. ODS05-4 TaxID=2944939 RepID=UPI00210EE720|nr:ATP-grasp domain-containing protein [Streptomyces sp. ODS05-4]